MDNNFNLNVAIDSLSKHSEINERRLSAIIDELTGPRPMNGDKPPQSPGLMGRIEHLARIQLTIEGHISELNRLIGTKESEKQMAATQYGQLDSPTGRILR